MTLPCASDVWLSEAAAADAERNVLLIIFDQFTDVDGTDVSNHTVAPINTPGNNWFGFSSTWPINSNQVSRSQNAVTERRFSPIIAGESDIMVEIVITPSDQASVSEGGLMVRMEGFPPFFSYQELLVVTLDRDNDLVFVSSITGGVEGAPIAQASYPIAAFQQYRLHVEADGSSIKVFVNGVLLISATITAHQTGDQHGFQQEDFSAVGTRWQFDDFKVGTFV